MDTLLYKSTRSVLMATSLIQLAVSQIYIEMMTKLFVREIGFFLFLFIISGLLILFNLTSMKETASGRLTMFIAMTISALAAGGVFIYKVWSDYLIQESVTLQVIQTSLIFAVISMVIYLIGGIIVTKKCLEPVE